ncbi:hypothetical protein HYC85_014670 [Camellia sinensis]|uniref:Uncharacterized protein n=1 Tax=Camellia sinensis TaxID=4442 RepID=A0A7J7H6V8_CAMSI|nr:hypothetical protein HYC85_014670 [Camellia sinensis]
MCYASLKGKRPPLVKEPKGKYTAAVMCDIRVAAFINEDDSTGDKILWKEINDGKQFLYPRLLFIITDNDFLLNLHKGKGPEKEKYEEKIRKLHLKRVAFRTMWLPAEDYPFLLGRIMRTSSFGLDLPMKVVDMFGYGLPVCAVLFHTLALLPFAMWEGRREWRRADKWIKDLCLLHMAWNLKFWIGKPTNMLLKGFRDECNTLK